MPVSQVCIEMLLNSTLKEVVYKVSPLVYSQNLFENHSRIDVGSITKFLAW